MDLRMLDTENLEKYIWRLGQAKDSGTLDIGWEEMADVINKEIGNEDSPYSEAAFRKPYQQAKRFYESGVFDILTSEEHIDELSSQISELEKQRVKTRDERTELRRVIREEARKESYREQVLRSIAEYDCKPLGYDTHKKINAKQESDNDLVIMLTDLHFGINIDTYLNKFNEDVFKDRLNKYLDKIFDVKTKHGSKRAYVILSELVSGIIHDSLRIENNQNLIEQFLTATDYISQFLSEMSYRFDEINVYMCPGNHSRIMQNKDKSLKGENIDHLAIPFLEAKLQNFANIKFNANELDESIASFRVRGNLVMASHGDKDSPEKVVEKFTMMFNEKPSIVCLGHRHTNGLKTVYNSKVISAGCVSGSDSYAIDKRLHNCPEQVIAVVNDNGLDCFYDVALN